MLGLLKKEPKEPAANATARDVAETAPEFVTLLRAPTPAAVLTLGYESPRAEVRSLRVDLDLRRARLELTEDALREKVPDADDVALNVFLSLGDRAGAAPRRVSRGDSAPVATFFSRVGNLVVRPLVAVAVLLWGYRVL